MKAEAMSKLPPQSQFEAHLGEDFRLHAGPEEAFAVTLIDVTGLRPKEPPQDGPAPARPTFSIVFRAPPDCRLAQRIYRLEHDEVGSFELFLVPIGPDRQGQRYEAVFN